MFACDPGAVARPSTHRQIPQQEPSIASTAHCETFCIATTCSLFAPIHSAHRVSTMQTCTALLQSAAARQNTFAPAQPCYGGFGHAHADQPWAHTALPRRWQWRDTRVASRYFCRERPLGRLCVPLHSPILHAAKTDALRNASPNLRIWSAQRKDRYLLDKHIVELRQASQVLRGDKDRLFGVSGTAPLQARVPQAHVRVLQGVGHLSMMATPKPTALLYAQSLEQIEPTPLN